MFRPNKTCLIFNATGATDVYGRPLPKRALRVPCGVVKLNLASVQTSVRADSSGSRGAAREVTADAIILVGPYVSVEIDDKIEISAFKLRVTGRVPRFNLQGDLDHTELHCIVWTE